MSNFLTCMGALFQNLSLTKQHSTLYTALLQLGKATYKELAIKANIPRSSCYEYIPDLQKIGLVSEVVDNKKKYLIPESPEKILTLLKEKQKIISNDIIKYEKEIPEILSEYRALSDRSSVTFYKGIEGIQHILNETLEEKGEILVLCQGDEPQFRNEPDPEYIENYLEEFKRLKCRSREIIEDRGTAREYQKKYNSKLQKILLAPPIKRSDTTHIDKIIYGNKVAIIAYYKERLVLIEDTVMAINEKITFNVLWNALLQKKYAY